jgi:hypothetical protein
MANIEYLKLQTDTAQKLADFIRAFHIYYDGEMKDGKAGDIIAELEYFKSNSPEGRNLI